MKTLDDLKREVPRHTKYPSVSSALEDDVISRVIDHLHAQGRIVPDGYVAVDIEEMKRAIMLIETAWMDEEPMPCELVARDILKGMIAAAQKVGG